MAREALVTGGTRGIGRAISEDLKAAGEVIDRVIEQENEMADIRLLPGDAARLDGIMKLIGPDHNSVQIYNKIFSALHQAREETKVLAIAAPVAEEREACAKVAEDFYRVQGRAHWYNELAAAIRARGSEGDG